jgi:hypothetical protein
MAAAFGLSCRFDQSLIGIFLIPAIFYMVEKLSGAAVHQGAERQDAAMSPPEPSPGQGARTCRSESISSLWQRR